MIAQAGGYTDQVHQLILGGPMMGFALHSDERTDHQGHQLPARGGTGRGTDAGRGAALHPLRRVRRGLPGQLLPQQLYWYARAQDFDKVQEYHLFDCIECGCCAYVCPAHIPLVHYYRFAKTEIWTQEREREKSDLARRRHEARQARLERIEQERKARLRKKKEALEKKPADEAADPKKAAIEAAMQRVAAKKAAQQAASRIRHESE